jgi:integrase
MTLFVRKRGKTYRLEGRFGERARRSTGERERVRLALGTASNDAAQKLHSRIERALADGPSSLLWQELRNVLPPETFQTLAGLVGYDLEQQPDAAQPTWQDLETTFKAWMTQRVILGKLRDSTKSRYTQTLTAFREFLKARGISELPAITRSVVEEFKAWRLKLVLEKKFSRGGRGVVLDTAILHRVFAFALNCELVVRNPVLLDGRPGDDPARGAQPFKAADLTKLREAAGQDLLTFLMLRWTGMRGSDVVGLRWGEIDWESREINRLTLKRSKRILIPVHQELLFALEIERDRRKPVPEEHVLINPANGKPLTRPRLYERMLALGRRAGVLGSHPHRFRDTYAVDMLARGASPYDVAKLLGDAVATIEKHYAPFVKELRERARWIMENGQGLEITGTPWAQPRERKQRTQ